jgi:hypothetical protein
MIESELVKLTNKVDAALIKWIDQHKIDPLSVSAVAIARMTLLCDSLGIGEEFRKFCLEVGNKPVPDQNGVVH